ncbi:MAG: hypothetical protein GC185_10830 [Alphaproteobacteria bacterium]|nr:hypothetical protein [Alphaproteobacteria bacterium]
MAVGPEIHINKNKKQLLQLLVQLIYEDLKKNSANNNLPDDEIVLSPVDAHLLQSLIDALLQDEEFILTSEFLENIATLDNNNVRQMKKIFLSFREARGKSRALEGIRWNEFQIRLGISNDFITKTSVVSPIPMETFIKKEKSLFISMRFPTAVTTELVKFVSQQKSNVIRVLRKENLLPKRSVKNVFSKIKEKISKNKYSIPKKKVYAATVLLSNMAVLYTTRDWSAIGVLSSMAGTASTIFTDDKKK